MKSILVPVEDHDGMEPVLRLAVLVARTFSATVEGLPLGPDIAEMVAADFSMSGVIFDDRTRRAFLRDAGTTFEGFMDRAGVPRRGAGGPEAPSFGWSGETLVSPSALGEIGRAYDLIVVGRPGTASHEPRRSTLEAALFDSGHPLLIGPPKMGPTCGDTIAIAWNGSSETARTLAFALPLLVRARDVAILAVPGLRLPGPSEADIARNLRRHSVPARVIPVGRRGGAHAGAGLPGGGERSRCRPDRQGRLHAEPHPADVLRQRHRRHPGRGRTAGVHGALSVTGSQYPTASVPRWRVSAAPASRPSPTAMLSAEPQASWTSSV